MGPNASSQNPEIAAFLERNHIAVLATAYKDTSAPHAAVIYYTSTSRLNLFFITKSNTQKSRNIVSNPQVALAIYEADSQTTAQINGSAQKIDDPDRLKTAVELMHKYSQATAQTGTLPADRLKAGDYVLYEVTPQSIRMGRYKYAADDQIFTTALPPAESLE